MDDLLTTFQQKYGDWIRDALVLFKLICYGGRWSARHKERRNTFKSITLMMWAYCQIDALPKDSIPEPDGNSLGKASNEAETASVYRKTKVPWVVTFLVHAFQYFPWKEFVVHIEKDKQTSIRLRSDRVYNTYAKHGACIMFEPEPGNATTITKAQLEDALVRAQKFSADYTMTGYRPTDSRPDWVGVWRVPCRQLYFCPSG